MNLYHRVITGGVAAICLLGAQAQGQGLFGPGTFPHFRGMSGLPGGGFGVRPDGSTGIDGAMAISTPIGYSLSGWHGAVGVSSLSFDSRFTWFNISRRSATFQSGGVAQIMFGQGGSWGSFTFSLEILSTLLDSTYNVQYQLPLKRDDFGVSIGVQDLLNRAGSAGEGDPTARDRSRSLFVAATTHLPHDTYVTLGIGDTRFKNRPFANASVGLTKRARLIGEYEAFGFNYALAYGSGRMHLLKDAKHDPEFTVSAGMVNGKRAILMFNFSF